MVLLRLHKDINKLKQDFNKGYFIELCKLVVINSETTCEKL